MGFLCGFFFDFLNCNPISDNDMFLKVCFFMDLSNKENSVLIHTFEGIQRHLSHREKVTLRLCCISCPVTWSTCCGTSDGDPSGSDSRAFLNVVFNKNSMHICNPFRQVITLWKKDAEQRAKAQDNACHAKMNSLILHKTHSVTLKSWFMTDSRQQHKTRPSA